MTKKISERDFTIVENGKELLNEGDKDSQTWRAKVFEFQPSNFKSILTARGAAIRIFFTCWIIFGLHFATNTVREIYPALTLGDRFSFDVSEYSSLHPDIFEIEGRGAFINNNPGASILGAIPYFLLRPVNDRIVERVQRNRAMNPANAAENYDSIYPMAREFYQKSREKGFDVKFGLAAAEMQFFVMAPVSALSVVVMFWIVSGLTKNRQAAILLALVYAFATPIFYRAAQLNQNALLAHFAFFSFALLWRFRVNDKKPFYFLAGLCAGWTVVLDYSGLVALGVLSGYAFARWFDFGTKKRQISDLIRFAAGVLICAAVLMFYQYICFGNPILPAQSYMPPAHFTELGYRGFAFPQADLFFETAFSVRYGLFTSAPVLLLAFFAPIWFGKKNRLLERREIVFVAAFVGLFFLFCAANQYGRMQFNTGVRHIVPIVPFLFLLSANVLLKMPRLWAILFGILGVYWSWCLAMYRDVEQGFGVFESIKHITLEGFRLPWLTTLERMNFVENVSPIPLMILCAAVIGAFWTIGENDREAKFQS